MVKNVTYYNPIHQEENTPLVTVLETRTDTKQSTAVDTRGAQYVIDLTKASFGGISYPKPGTQWYLKKISGVWALMARAPRQNPQLDPSFNPQLGESYIGNGGKTVIVGDLTVTGGFAVGGEATSVKSHGAVGDGVTDDYAAITAAITASPYGGIVFFPPGTYMVSSTIKLLKGRTYMGAGREGTSVKAMAATNLDAVMASETWLSVVGGSPTSDNPISIRNLKIDGNSSAQVSGAGNGLALITFWNTLENLEVVNNRGHGILLTSARRDGTEISNTAVECKVIRCDVRASGAVGIYVKDPSSSSQTVTDGWVVDCVVQDTVNEGIAIDTPAGWLVQGNHLYGVAMSGIYLNRGGFTRVIGNYIETYGFSASSGTYSGIMCGGDGGSFIGAPGPMIFADNTLIYTGGAAAGSAIRGIRLEASNGAVGHVILANNGLYGSTHVATSYGIRVGNQGATGSLIIQANGNMVFGWDTQFSYLPSGGLLTVTGDVFQPGISTSSTAGFGRLPSCAGPPTGVPADLTNGAPAIYDTTNNKLWVYNGSWRGVVLT